MSEEKKSDRELLMERYEEHAKAEKENAKDPLGLSTVKIDSPPKEEVKEPLKEEAKPETKKEETVAPAKKGDAVAPTEKDAPGKPVKEERIKMVPHAALHEERLRSKELRTELEKFKSDQDALLEEIKALKEDREAGVGIVDGNDEKMRKLEKEMNDLRSSFSKRIEDEQRRVTEHNRSVLQEQIRSTNDELMAEGFKGFDIFKAQVAEELQKLVAEEPANVHLDNPEGWKKIFKEKVYPRVSAIFAEQAREEKFKEKERLAEDAKLVSSPGSAPTKEEEKQMTPEEAYIEMRRKRAASST